MVTFDTANLKKSTFRGVEFNTLETSVSSGKRLTTHRFIDSGTKTEENGNKEEKFTIQGYLTGTDYLTNKTALKKALDAKGSGTLVDTYYGEVDVFVDTYTFKESSKSNGKLDISITFEKVTNQLTQTEFVNMSKNQSLIDNSFVELKQNFNTNVGSDVLGNVAETIKTTYSVTNNAIKFIPSNGNTKEVLQNAIDLAIDSTNASSVTDVNSIISNLTSINAAVDNFYSENDVSESDMKASSNLIYEAANIVNNVDETKLDEVEKLELINKRAFINTQTILQLSSLNEKLEDVDFSTGDSFGETKEDNLATFHILNNTSTSNEVLSDLKDYKVTYIDFVTQKYSSLQNLQDLDQQATTDIYSLTLDKYNDINRVKEVLTNNDILDPIFINGDLKVLKR